MALQPLETLLYSVEDGIATITLANVDLPEPDVPSSPTNSPSATESDTPSSARTVADPIA